MIYAACEICDSEGAIYWPEDFSDDRNGYSSERCRNCQGAGWVPCAEYNLAALGPPSAEVGSGGERTAPAGPPKDSSP